MKKSSKTHIGILIKRHRIIQGLTQKELAEKIGKTQAHLSYMETSGFINKYTLMEIADGLGVSIEELENINQYPDFQTDILKKQEEYYCHLIQEIKYLREVIQKQNIIIESLTQRK